MHAAHLFQPMIPPRRLFGQVCHYNLQCSQYVFGNSILELWIGIEVSRDWEELQRRGPLGPGFRFYVKRPHGLARRIATPVHDLPGCEGRLMRSFIFVHKDAFARSLADLQGLRTAVNNHETNSGSNSGVRLPRLPKVGTSSLR
ncbi:hypothetical protein BN77_p10369 [Rhizobium mesoamericanum STM3625]|uniref:Uncharacterized protein n=1 Tax=Rhizobium mesoamericanum STM3625 TaxID=1211777 RepID=K0Q626_9HYPH|nr:hypothetical protein BN77_p10369 [Rhizobium mesoamericanum STM3625]